MMHYMSLDPNAEHDISSLYGLSSDEEALFLFLQTWSQLESENILAHLLIKHL